jgi:DNA-binding CsgD family transcriptional regulator
LNLILDLFNEKREKYLKLKMILPKRLCFFLICWQLSNNIFCQIKGIGLPEIKNFKQRDYNGGTQNWGIDQDKNGNVYFANNSGLFQYDGSTWHQFNMPNHPSIRAIKIGADEKIYVGGYNDFGYFETNSKGRLKFVSLINLVNSNNRQQIDFIWKIHFYKNEVIFQSFERAYIYNGKTIRQLEAPNRFQFSFIVNDRLLFQDKLLGLMEYRNNKLIQLSNTTNLNNTEVWGIFPLSSTKILICTLNSGLFIYESNALSTWNTSANNFTKKNSCLGGSIIKGGYLLLNTVLDGIIICDLSGNIVQHLNQKNGLQNNTVLNSFIDFKNNLWLGLDNGITFINESSPLSYFGISYDVSTVYASIVSNGLLYVATNRGLFYHSWNEPFSAEPFTLVEGTTGQTWNIQQIGGQLYCSHNQGLLLIKGNKVVNKIDNKGYFSVKQIPNNSTACIGANYNGFSLLELNAGNITFKSDIEGNTKSSNNFEIEGNAIWILKDKLLYQMKLGSDFKRFKSIKTYDKLSEKSVGIENFEFVNNKLNFHFENKFYNFSYENDQFTENHTLNTIFKTLPKVHSVVQDANLNIWFVYNESIGMLKPNTKQGYNVLNSQFSSLKGNLVTEYLSINAFNKKNTFIGLTSGLAHFNAGQNIVNDNKPKAFLRSFITNTDTLVFGNNSNKLQESTRIKYSANNVKFTFSSPMFESLENVEFAFKLDGFDTDWSPWTANTFKEYTYLREGDYSMNVKVRNNLGVASEANSFEFSVSPPFYRHFLAYILYLVAIIYGIYFGQKRLADKIKQSQEDQKNTQQKLFLEKENKIKLEQIELEKEIEKLKNENLKIKLLSKDKELVNNSYQVVKQNKVLNGILLKLKDINTNQTNEATKAQINRLNKSIIKEVNSDKSQKDLEKHIKNVHFDFLKRLKEKCPDITSRELDLATYLLLNMSSKEIADVINISPAGVELARYRLRKKLGLVGKENLVGYLMQI